MTSIPTSMMPACVNTISMTQLHQQNFKYPKIVQKDWWLLDVSVKMKNKRGVTLEILGSIIRERHEERTKCWRKCFFFLFQYLCTCWYIKPSGCLRAAGHQTGNLSSTCVWGHLCLIHTASHAEVGLAFRWDCLCLGTSFLTAVIRSTLSRDLTTVMVAVVLYFKTLWVSTELRITGSTPKFMPFIIEFASA